MGANKSKVPNNFQNNEHNKPIISYLLNIKSKYILKLIFDHFEQKKVFKLINYNKGIQNRMEIGLKDYKFEFMYTIKIEIYPKNNCASGTFIKYITDVDKYHIYFGEETKERKVNFFSLENRARKVKIILKFKDTSLKGLFKGCKCIEKINFIKFDRTDIIDMSYMFFECSSLKEVNLSNLKTDNVKDMSFMFYQCNSLTELNLSKFNTIELTNMKSIFSRCESLEKMDLSNFETPKVEDMSYMFYECYRLDDVNLSKFINKELTNMSYMFYGCVSLTRINMPNIELNCETIDNKLIFSGCNSLKLLIVKNFNEDDRKYIFKGCKPEMYLYLEITNKI